MYCSSGEKIVIDGKEREAQPGCVFDVFTDPDGRLIIEETSAPLFFSMTKQRIDEVRHWFEAQAPKKPQTENEKRFLEIVAEGLKKIDYEYEVLTVEPCQPYGAKRYLFLTKDFGKYGVKIPDSLYYSHIAYSIQNSFVPGKKLEMGLLSELFLWYAWRIYRGYWNLNIVCNDTAGFGYYGYGFLYFSTKQDRLGRRHMPAEKFTAGFRDNVGNSEIMVMVDDNHVTTVGASCTRYRMDSDEERPIGAFGPVYEILRDEDICKREPDLRGEACHHHKEIYYPVRFDNTSPFIVNRLK